MQPQEDMQIMPTRATGEETCAVSYNMALGSTLLLERPGNALCARVQYLCDHDFRDELWYLDNFFLILFYVTGAACVILGLPFNSLELLRTMVRPNTTYAFVVAIVVSVGLGGITPIPLCGIMSSIHHRRRHPPLLISLAIDSGKRYRVCRWIFYFCAPIAGMLFGVINPARHGLLYPIIPLLIWCGTCWMISFYALPGAYSRYTRRYFCQAV